MKRKISTIVAVILLVVSAVIAFLALRDTAEKEEQETIMEETKEKATEDIPADPLDRVIDWAYLKSINPDIIAWLYIPGTNIDYPVCHSEGDYYLRRNIYGQYSVLGTLFTNETMKDPHVVIFGHNMNSDTMFGRLQESGFQTAYIYTPGEAGRYTKVSDLICSKQDSIFQRGFSYGEQYQEWLSEHELEVREDEQVISLAACADGNRSKRYVANLVCEEKRKHVNLFM